LATLAEPGTAIPDEPPVWERRFRAPLVSFPDWSLHSPGRLVYASNESGIWQAYAWDQPTGARRRVTDDPVGVAEGTPTLDGEGVLWFHDETGDESGRWLVQPFPGGATRPFLEGVPDGWNDGLAQGPGVVAAAISDRGGFAVYAAIDGAPAKELYRSTESVSLGGADRGGWFGRAALSSDGSLLCLEHAEHGDLIHPALRVVDPRTGATVGELLDEGMALTSACWSPVPGDLRLAVTHERDGEERPAIWDLATGRRTDLSFDVSGRVVPHDWWPDGSALLLTHLQEGRHRLLRYEPADDRLTLIETPAGTITRAMVRPDGRIWYLHAQGHRQPMVLDDEGAEVLRAEGERAPEGRPYVSWDFSNPHGQRVHGFHVTPDPATAGPAPHPVVMFVHGGPTSLDMDRWQPEVQAYVDAGFAVGLVNYRGSVGYGREWRDALIGDVGGPELEDVNAGLADLVTRGIADPSRAVIAGWSWGGYVTLLELAKHPELWVCGIAGVPVADYEASYQDSSPLLQAYDRALLGGTPADVPELMRDRSPIHFVDRVRAPVLIIAGEHDSRCPIRQVMNYVERLKAIGLPHDVYLFSTGHGTFDVEERVRQQRRILEFLEQHVPKK
jgi:dipeptidyl aminopeptidase/acylaminoacyl peptidase